MTKDEQTAASLLAEGLVSYNISSPKNPPDITFNDLRQPGNLDDTKRHIHHGESTQELGEDGQMHKNFTVRVTEPPRLYKHTKALHGSPLDGPWPAYYTDYDTLMSSILKESLPRNMTAKAFERWDYKLEHPSIVSEKAKRLQTAACLPSRMASPPKSGDASSVADEESG